VFLIGQALIAFDALAARLGFATPVSAPRPGAADWRPGQEEGVVHSTRGSFFASPRAALSMTLTFVAAAAFAAIAVSADGLAPTLSTAASWCGLH
jgi:hypothetical protein